MDLTTIRVILNIFEGDEPDTIKNPRINLKFQSPIKINLYPSDIRYWFKETVYYS